MIRELIIAFAVLLVAVMPIYGQIALNDSDMHSDVKKMLDPYPFPMPGPSSNQKIIAISIYNSSWDKGIPQPDPIINSSMIMVIPEPVPVVLAMVGPHPEPLPEVLLKRNQSFDRSINAVSIPESDWVMGNMQPAPLSNSSQMIESQPVLLIMPSASISNSSLFMVIIPQPGPLPGMVLNNSSSQKTPLIALFNQTLMTIPHPDPIPNSSMILMISEPDPVVLAIILPHPEPVADQILKLNQSSNQSITIISIPKSSWIVSIPQPDPMPQPVLAAINPVPIRILNSDQMVVMPSLLLSKEQNQSFNRPMPINRLLDSNWIFGVPWPDPIPHLNRILIIIDTFNRVIY